MSDAQRYADAARALIQQGNELRDQGIRGRDTDVTVTPTNFLDLLAEAWDEGYNSRWDGAVITRSIENPYRAQARSDARDA